MHVGAADSEETVINIMSLLVSGTMFRISGKFLEFVIETQRNSC